MESIFLKITLIFIICSLYVKLNCKFSKIIKALSSYKKSLITLKNSVSLDVIKKDNEIEANIDQIIIKGLDLLFKFLQFSLPYILFYFSFKLLNININNFLKIILPALSYLVLLRR
ncbi:MAG: hypothetical protein CMK49_02130 [Prochlorococcus sp. SP3034]|nr:hypothetical protein [Prochlorococcus sp. SP3034]|tara:strand:+ start:8852 stop:9199 length:348 start_codon:yes stop_codon:yes gene_type:complete